MSKRNCKYCRITVLIFLAISLCIPPAHWGPAAALAGDGPSYAVKKATAALRTKITQTWVNESIDKVLMDLADLANVDIVKSPKVTGNVTAKVTDVPLEEALTNILAAHEYTYVATDSMIRVVPISMIALAKEELVSKVYRITYADANDVAASLRNFVSKTGSVAVNRGTSHIVVTDTEYKIRAVDKFIAEIDRQTQQVLVEVKIYDITTREGFDLNSALYAANRPLETLGPLAYPTSVTKTFTPGYEITDVETREGTLDETMPGLVERHEIDIGPYDVLNPGDERGQTFQRRTDTSTEVVPDITTTETSYDQLPISIGPGRPWGGKPFVGGSFDRRRGGTLSFSLLNDSIDLEFALNMLKKEVEFKVLANPRILVLDNETADFGSIREIPYRELRQVAREDPITYTDFKDVGVQLKVTPHIARDGLIKLRIVPEFGILVSQDIYGVPTVDTRRTDTVALIRDGQTIAIGGMRKRQTSKQISKVPFLGDIPLLGNLFRSTTESVEINELVVLITPRIIKSSRTVPPELSQYGKNGIPKAFREAPKPQREVRKLQNGYKEILESSSSDPVLPKRGPKPTTLKLAYGYLKMQRFDLAKEMLASVIQRQPDNSTAYQYLGYCHLKLGELNEATQSYLTAVDLNNADWEAQRGLGVAYMLKARADGDTDLAAKAIEQWQISLDIKPDQANAQALHKMIDAYTR